MEDEGGYVRRQILVAMVTWERALREADRREMSGSAWVREAIREKLERDNVAGDEGK